MPPYDREDRAAATKSAVAARGRRAPRPTNLPDSADTARRKPEINRQLARDRAKPAFRRRRAVDRLVGDLIYERRSGPKTKAELDRMRLSEDEQRYAEASSRRQSARAMRESEKRLERIPGAFGFGELAKLAPGGTPAREFSPVRGSIEAATALVPAARGARLANRGARKLAGVAGRGRKTTRAPEPPKQYHSPAAERRARRRTERPRPDSLARDRARYPRFPLRVSVESQLRHGHFPRPPRSQFDVVTPSLTPPSVGARRGRTVGDRVRIRDYPKKHPLHKSRAVQADVALTAAAYLPGVAKPGGARPSVKPRPRFVWIETPADRRANRRGETPRGLYRGPR